MGRVLGDVGEGKLLAVGLADVLHRAVHAHGALFNPDGALADSLDLVHGVAHQQDGYVSGIDKVLDTLLAFALEEHIAYR